MGSGLICLYTDLLVRGACRFCQGPPRNPPGHPLQTEQNSTLRRQILNLCERRYAESARREDPSRTLPPSGPSRTAPFVAR
eukprot:14804269-Alexandrium_andersonii.AAC.1